jgi:hypothetical protein
VHAEDSHNVLPALLGEKINKPLRSDMIVHSADGVFAIRQGPWKWIEGESSKPQPPKARTAEFKPQLYNLEDDPGEATDVSARHPDVVKAMATLLDRYRDGGYSRELPAVSAKQAGVVTMPAPAMRVVLTNALDQVPVAPWVVVRGQWRARDGAVWASQKAGEPGPAALRSSLTQTDGDIRYELNLPSNGTHTLRVQCASRKHVLLVDVSRTRTSVSEQSSGRQLAQVRTHFRAGEWLPVRVCFRGPDLFVQAGETSLKVSDAVVGEAKAAFALLGYGEAVGFRRVAVTMLPE